MSERPHPPTAPSHLSPLSKFHPAIPQIATPRYALQNLLIASTTLVAAVANLAAATVYASIALVNAIIPRKPLPENKSRRRNVMITGVTGGIGSEVALLYANNKHHLILIGRSKDKMDTLGKRLSEKGATFESHIFDHLNHDHRKAFSAYVKELSTRIDGIDIVVAVAGTAGHMAEAYQDDQWGLDVCNRITETNVNGTLTLVMAVWEDMVKRKSGHICIVGSSAGVFAPATFCAYGASKAYWSHFAQSLRVVSLPYNVKVNIALPGFIDTRMTVNMRSWNSVMPDFMFAPASGMAAAIVSGIEHNECVTNWPLNQLLPLYGAKVATPLNEEIGRLVGAASLATGVTMS